MRYIARLADILLSLYCNTQYHVSVIVILMLDACFLFAVYVAGPIVCISAIRFNLSISKVPPAVADSYPLDVLFLFACYCHRCKYTEVSVISYQPCICLLVKELQWPCSCLLVCCAVCFHASHSTISSAAQVCVGSSSTQCRLLVRPAGTSSGGGQQQDIQRRCYMLPLSFRQHIIQTSGVGAPC